MPGMLPLLALFLPGGRGPTSGNRNASPGTLVNASDLLRARQDERRTVTTTITTGVRPPPAASTRQRLVVLVLDLSSSMSGSLLNRVLDACQLVTNRLSPNDYIVIWGFNNIATKAHCGLVGKLDFKRLRKDMQKNCGGSTALFDAIGDAHQGMVDNRRGKPPCHPFLIVFTDGGDNSSTKTSADVKSILQRSPVTKLRTIFITAGLSPGDAASVSNALPQGGVMFQAGTDDESIKREFKRAGNLMHVGALEVTLTDTANNTTSRVTITTQAPTQGGVANNMNALAAQMGSSFAGLGLGAARGLPPSRGRPALPAPRPRSSSRFRRANVAE